MRAPDNYEERRERARVLLRRNPDALTGRERLVLARIFALDGEPRPTYRALGRELGLSQERIHQILKRAEWKLGTVGDTHGLIRIGQSVLFPGYGWRAIRSEREREVRKTYMPPPINLRHIEAYVAALESAATL